VRNFSKKETKQKKIVRKRTNEMNDISGNGKTEDAEGQTTATKLKAMVTAAKNETQQLELDMEQLNLQIATARDKENTRRELCSRIEAAKQAEDDRKIRRAAAIETLNAAETLASDARARALQSSTSLVHLQDSLARAQHDREHNNNQCQQQSARVLRAREAAQHDWHSTETQPVGQTPANSTPP
jgi:hypothetical protein